jgi:hypothetical protein
MRLREPITYSFIIRILIEPPAEDSPEMYWQGQITHVPSGEQAYFRNLDTVAQFVSSYIEDSGARQHSVGRLQHWFRQLTRCGRRGR